jgi:hypothetical protein
MTNLPLNRPLAAFVLLTFCVSVGCTAYRDAPSGYDWEPIPLSELPGSEDKFKGKRMAFRLAPEGRIEVVVERIDSTFVYAWGQWDDDSPQSSMKIRLNTVKVAEIHHKSSHAGRIALVTIPFVLLLIAVAVMDKQIDDAEEKSR